MSYMHEFSAERRQEIIARCRSALPEECVEYQAWGNMVLQIDMYSVVKYGPAVSKDEAENQTRIWELVDHEIVRVPQVYDWFQDAEGWGYLVMEFVAGDRTRHLNDDRYRAKLVRMAEHLHSIKSTQIGPLHTGPHRAMVFGEGPSPVLRSTQDVEAWFSRRLLNDDRQVDFSKLDLVLCHLDFTCRNILWIDDSVPCLIDWASAGFYPRFFEKLCHSIVWQPEDGDIILNMELSTVEDEQYWLVAKAFANDMRFCL